MSNVLQRLKRYAGKQRRNVVNPGITAHEAIAIANYIAKLEAENDKYSAGMQENCTLRQRIAELEEMGMAITERDNTIEELEINVYDLEEEVESLSDRLDSLSHFVRTQIGQPPE